jgi:hypothetical protein
MKAMAKYQFPQHDIKVRETQTNVDVKEVTQGIVVH